LPVVAVEGLAGDSGDQRGGRVGVVVSAVDAGAAVGGEQIAGQGEYRGEADRIGVDVQIDRGADSEAHEGVVDREQGPEFLVGQFRGLPAQPGARLTQGGLQSRVGQFDLPAFGIECGGGRAGWSILGTGWS